MTRVYRILRRPYAKQPFNGEGAYRFGGRWSNPGTRLAYAAEHMSLAMIEYFVHVEADDPPTDLVLASADIPDSVSRESVSAVDLPANWRMTPPPPQLAAIGDRFAQRSDVTILIVPSALAPDESNWLINPLHPEFRKIRLRPPQSFQYDARFF